MSASNSTNPGKSRCDAALPVPSKRGQIQRLPPWNIRLGRDTVLKSLYHMAFYAPGRAEAVSDRSACGNRWRVACVTCAIRPQFPLLLPQAARGVTVEETLQLHYIDMA
ncbi:hypothetical protein K6V72_06600 [Ralstonia insidiosa]|uniref:hypothetical protein n=1 Tax=Ralstonia insidiosa TaxID=190721 RepID=UPI0012456F78|nr:hypothetical protein [Ralstonia insidiosa]KAB0471789.1 hypothetical protein F7R11_04170 [Ralstonia insidiosa]MBY4908650.1 hypothetical protein [Ralstonia insidiosa]